VPISISPDQDLLAVWLNDLPRTPAESRERATAVFGDAIRERHAKLRSVLVSPDPNDEEIAAAVEAAQGCALVIAGTINLHLNPGQKKMIEALAATNLPLVWISFASPYDLNHFPQAETYLCAYSWRPASVEATVRVLFGEIEASGKLPVELS
jgi:beta-N-acetylhexosaminidase